MIVTDGLTKHFGKTLAVDDLRFTVTPGVPLREVGALLDAKAFHPGRSARNHLRCLARTNDIPVDRVDEVLDVVGLNAVAERRAGRFSLGMGQPLGIAAAPSCHSSPCSGWGSVRSSGTVRAPSRPSWDARCWSPLSSTTWPGTRASSCP